MENQIIYCVIGWHDNKEWRKNEPTLCGCHTTQASAEKEIAYLKETDSDEKNMVFNKYKIATKWLALNNGTYLKKVSE